VIHALTGGGVVPDNLSDCDDTGVMISALRDNPYEINIKAGGTAMRFMTALLSVRAGEEHVLTGTERMQHRPIHVLVEALRRLGADIEYMGEEGFPPLRIRGRQLEGGLLEVPGNISSQFVSALLLIGPMLRDGLTLRLKGDIISRPYIDLTLWTMREFNAFADWDDFETIMVAAKPYEQHPYYIESDWSAASYWYEMMALSRNAGDEVLLEGLMDGSKQGDSSVRYLFSLLGVKTTFESTKPGVPTMVRLQHSGCCVSRLDYDFVNSPDLAQTFIVCCAVLGIPFHFRGLSTLKIKETDRIEAMKKEMRKLGYVIHDKNNSELIWDGERCMPEIEGGIDTYEDHRMALSFAPASLCIDGLSINNPQVVTKSYPHFWEDIKSAGFEVIND
jgi:3-phosphoshikimate 1-carboxyvinyltransferase